MSLSIIPQSVPKKTRFLRNKNIKIFFFSNWIENQRKILLKLREEVSRLPKNYIENIFNFE